MHKAEEAREVVRAHACVCDHVGHVCMLGLGREPRSAGQLVCLLCLRLSLDFGSGANLLPSSPHL